MRFEHKRYITFTEEELIEAILLKDIDLLEQYRLCTIKELLQAVFAKRELCVNLELFTEDRGRFWNSSANSAFELVCNFNKLIIDIKRLS